MILDGDATRITRVTRHAVRLFRPPYGSFDARTLGDPARRADADGAGSVDPLDFARTALAADHRRDVCARPGRARSCCCTTAQGRARGSRPCAARAGAAQPWLPARQRAGAAARRPAAEAPAEAARQRPLSSVSGSRPRRPPGSSRSPRPTRPRRPSPAGSPARARAESGRPRRSGPRIMRTARSAGPPR